MGHEENPFPVGSPLSLLPSRIPRPGARESWRSAGIQEGRRYPVAAGGRKNHFQSVGILYSARQRGEGDVHNLLKLLTNKMLACFLLLFSRGEYNGATMERG